MAFILPQIKRAVSTVGNGAGFGTIHVQAVKSPCGNLSGMSANTMSGLALPAGKTFTSGTAIMV